MKSHKLLRLHPKFLKTMLKYVNTDIVFQEIPDEVTLAVNISNCPCRCPGCHSTYLWQDIGKPLTGDVMDKFMQKYGDGITCVCFMGGDGDPAGVASLSRYMHKKYPCIKVGWYSGRTATKQDTAACDFDYVKFGPFNKALGGLKSKTTNQRLYKRGGDGRLIDITSRFWQQSD